MKFFLIILLFAFCVLIATFVYMYYLIRKKLFGDMVYICKYLKNNISFNKNEINVLLTDSFQNINSSSKYILKNNSKSISKIFTKENKSLINDFFKSLGKGDVNFEINNIDYYLNNFENLESKSKEEIKTKALMYFKLIIGFGLILCILLI